MAAGVKKRATAAPVVIDAAAIRIFAAMLTGRKSQPAMQPLGTSRAMPVPKAGSQPRRSSNCILRHCTPGTRRNDCEIQCARSLCTAFQPEPMSNQKQSYQKFIIRSPCNIRFRSALHTPGPLRISLSTLIGSWSTFTPAKLCGCPFSFLGCSGSGPFPRFCFRVFHQCVIFWMLAGIRGSA
jgi:hypothetical protein